VRERSDLRADCASCAGLCCVVPALTVSADFAIDKPSGVPCPNLATDDFGCTIHDELRERGFPGCTVYDCFGAGQRVVQEHFAGREWRASPEIRVEMFATFEVVERLHELLWYVEDAASRRLPRELREEVEGLRTAVERAAATPDERDVVPLQLRADALFGEVSVAVRRGGRDLRRQDLVGRDLRGEGVTDANLRGTLLLGADLRGVDLGLADLLGADLRAADLRGADLSQALFLTRLQVAAMRTDETTLLPGWAAR
jgi:Pentapeptide repeats (8 copies)